MLLHLYRQAKSHNPGYQADVSWMKRAVRFGLEVKQDANRAREGGKGTLYNFDITLQCLKRLKLPMGGSRV